MLTELCSTLKIVDNFAVPGDTAESDLVQRVSLYLKSVSKKPLDSTKTYHGKCTRTPRNRFLTIYIY
jgi:hypothetical protein